MTTENKKEIKRKIINGLSAQKEIKKVILFGSFISSDSPNDVDIAIFQDSDENYISLALKYRKILRAISKEIPLDVFPLKVGGSTSAFLEEIESGEVVYER